MLVLLTLVALSTLVAVVGVIDGYCRWGDDYLKYGAMGCAERDFWNDHYFEGKR